MIITTTLGVLAACGTSIIAGANIIGGWRQRKFQKAEGECQRKFSQEMQERQLQFQRALQEKNLRHAEELQRKMVLLQFQTALALQKENYNSQRMLWEDTNFYLNQWPLRASPKHYVDELVNTYKVEKVPLQILVPSSLSERIGNLGNIMKSAYSMRSNSPTYYYDGGWKNGSTIVGTALLSTLHSVLKGLPTLVLIPSGSFRDKVKIEIGYWGLGRLNEMPELREVASIDMHKLDLSLIRKHTDDLIELYRGEEDKLRAHANVAVRREELARCAELTKRGTSQQKIEMMLRNEFASKYQRNGIEWDIEDAKQKILGTVLEVVCAGYSDVYHMLEFNTMPQAPFLAKTNSLFADAEVRTMLVGLYDRAIETLGYDAETRLSYPLCSALIAKSCHEAGWTDDAKVFGKKAEAALLNIYRGKPDNVMPSHCEAMRLLLDCGLSDSKSRIAYVADDRFLAVFPGTSKVPSSQVSSKRQNELARLKSAADSGSCRACLTLYFALKDSDRRTALHYLKTAADKNDWDALYVMADECRRAGKFAVMEDFYVRGAQLGDPRALKQLKHQKKDKQMLAKKDGGASASELIGRAADALLDGLIGLVVRAKEKSYEELSFDEVRRLACGLRHECAGHVKGYKCYIVFDRDNVCYKVGIFPVDVDMNTFGGKDVVMEVVRAESLDGKLVSLMRDSKGGKFFISAE